MAVTNSSNPERAPVPRLGINTEILLGVLLAGLLGWVGITTYQSALKLTEIKAQLSYIIGEQEDTYDQLQAEIDRLERHQSTIWPRLRQLEQDRGLAPAPPDASGAGPPD